MISEKGKRKLIYKDQLFYWFVKLDEDYDMPYLHIISEDKQLCLVYRVNQISDEFIHPKIRVLKSDKMKKGLYCFFSPVADESISTHNVRAVLNWHEQQNENLDPIEVRVPTNPFEDIDFKDGYVTHIETDFSRDSLREDMLQVIYPKGYLLDVGWYGASEGFIVSIIKDQDWGNPIRKTRKSIFNLNEAVVKAIEIIGKLMMNK